MISTILFMAQRWFQWKTVSVRMHVPFWVKIRALLFPNMGREDLPSHVCFCIFRNLSCFVYTPSVFTSHPEIFSSGFLTWSSQITSWDDKWLILDKCKVPEAAASGKASLGPTERQFWCVWSPTGDQHHVSAEWFQPGTCLCPCEHGLISGRNTTNRKFLTMKWLSGT